MKNVNDLEKPHWLELPEEEKQTHTYWVTYGTVRGIKPNRKWWQRKPKQQVRRRFTAIMHSKEEAEAHSCTEHSNGWVWDRRPATPITLQEALSDARVCGRDGVHVVGYRDGEWVVLKEYLSGVPLEESPNA
jgi:hypothetical protein